MADTPSLSPNAQKMGGKTSSAPRAEVLHAPIQAPPFTSVPRHSREGISTVEIVALFLSLAWLGLVGWFFLTIDSDQARLTRADPLGFMMTILGVFLPVALIWVAASAARTARTMREESARLQAAIDAMRLSYVEQQQMAGVSLKRAMEERIETVARAQVALGAEVAGLHAKAAPEQVLDPPERPAAARQEQKTLALGAEDRVALPLAADDFIRALNFPRNERDKEGFAVLRRALDHRGPAQLVSAAQDVLTLLSQDGIYMDDLTPAHTNPETWRAFAGGTRGADIAGLGAIRDRSSLALAVGRMKEDTVFRDAMHHFLRTFDRVFADFTDTATDHEITRFADTRTARAFMLLGRVAGTFD